MRATPWVTASYMYCYDSCLPTPLSSWAPPCWSCALYSGTILSTLHLVLPVPHIWASTSLIETASCLITGLVILYRGRCDKFSSLLSSCLLVFLTEIPLRNTQMTGMTWRLASCWFPICDLSDLLLGSSLGLTLADFSWCWLTLTDVDWLWLILSKNKNDWMKKGLFEKLLPLKSHIEQDLILEWSCHTWVYPMVLTCKKINLVQMHRHGTMKNAWQKQKFL